MQASTEKKQFYFINKTDQSSHLSRSLQSEKVAIQRHVQTGRQRSRKSKSKVFQTKEDHVDDELQPTLTLALLDHVSLNARPASRELNENEPAVQKDRIAFAHDASLTYQSILQKQDPFDVTSVPLDKPVAGLLHYYMYHHHPSQWPNEMVFLRRGIYVFEGSVMGVLKTAVTDRLTMYCLLSAAACRLQFIDRFPCSFIAGTENFYIQNALQLMARAVATDNFEDDGRLKQLLFCIIFLNSAEAYRGQMSAARTHLNAAVKLLEPRGGLPSIRDDNLLLQFAMADLFLGCINLQPCMFDCSYDPGPASSLKLSEDELHASRQDATLSYLLNRSDGLLIPRLQTLIQELAESLTIRDRALTDSMAPLRAMQITHWITRRNMAIRHNLLALKTADATNLALRAAIIMWTLLTMNLTGRAKTVKIMAPRLRSSLYKMPQASSTDDKSFRLWISLIGYQCASEGSKESVWFFDECRALYECCTTSTHGISSVSDLATRLENFQLNFFFDETVQRPLTQSLAQKLYSVTA